MRNAVNKVNPCLVNHYIYVMLCVYVCKRRVVSKEGKATNVRLKGGMRTMLCCHGNRQARKHIPLKAHSANIKTLKHV